MDLRVYYQKLRKIEAEITEPFVVLMSRETPDGGKAGVLTDVPRSVAAKMIVEERADLANPEQSKQFREEAERAWKAGQPAPQLPVEPITPLPGKSGTGKKL
jgi:hypothetical protein